ncbi:MAG TPA: M48 family metalloprotease [Allosphingosinicella sp.]|jgi:Zn-dependent protease with chaperone function|nr:M48 family metalloprotease [Allosphingosinicella sp.]
MAGLFAAERELVVADEPAGAWGAAIRVDERYRALVERLSRTARSNPDGYRRRVVLAAALGYAVILALILVCAATIAGLLYMVVFVHLNLLLAKLGVVAAVIGWAVVRSLWVPFEAPDGRPLERNEAPELFGLIARLKAQIGGPKIHEVLVTRDFNAAIVQTPRLGILGWYRNYLVLGLPLLQALSEAEATAVISHEIGHFAGRHGHLAALVYRVRMVWAQLSERLQEGHSASLLRRFFAWYGPWFNAYSFVLARSHEYEADRTAAEATSKDTIAAALIRLAVQADRLDAGWSGFWDEAVKAPAPVRGPFAVQALWLREADEVQARRSLSRGLARSTGLEDTHPSLADRLAALGAAPRIPPSPDLTAAEALLGRTADSLAAEFDESWWAEAADWIAEARERRRADAEELGSLRELAASGPLTLEQRHRQAELTALIEGEQASLTLYDSIAADYPDDEAAAWFAGLYRLRLGDPAGVPLVESASARNPQLLPAACAALEEFYGARGDDKAAAGARARLAETLETAAAAETEFRTLRPDSEIQAPDLSDEERAEFRRSVDGIPGLRAVHVGWRHLVHVGARQQVLLVKFRGGVDTDPRDVLGSVGERLLPWGDYIGFTLAADTRWLDRKLRAIEGTQLYP